MAVRSRLVAEPTNVLHLTLDTLPSDGAFPLHVVRRESHLRDHPIVRYRPSVYAAIVKTIGRKGGFQTFAAARHEL